MPKAKFREGSAAEGWPGEALERAFVAVAGVLQNGKLVLCNVVVEISEGFWQFLIVCCGCSPCSDLQKYVLKQRKR